jgi:hypothetical protein
MLISKNHSLLFLLLIYTILGIYLSITTGISHDEHHEQLNWQVNIAAIKNFLATGNYDNLLNYKDRYHGIGFHLISQPLQIFIYNYVSDLNQISDYGGFIISKHAVVFLLFSISGIFFYLLSFKFSQNFNFSICASAIYLSYPYFFGHAQINPKDMPFLSIWIINSYIFLTIVESLFYQKKIKINKIVIFSFLTAFLISVRITGIIIFIEYFIGLIILFNIKKITLPIFIKNYYTIFIAYTILLLFFVYLLNPILWHSPLEIFNSIKWMGKYQQNVCTLTLGNCLKSLNLPPSYYFIWFFFKLPILVILGLLLFPFVEKKIFKEKVTFIYYGTFLFTVVAVLLIFILKNVALYDEIRHIMFLLPMIFLVSLSNIFYFNKKLFYTSSIFLILFFALENYSINPYQYTWLNSFAKTVNIQKNFEIDYWGISNKNLQKKIIEYSENNFINKNTCVYGDQYVKEFLLKKNFKCFKNYSEIDTVKQRPFFAYKNVRNVKRSNPKDCELIWNESYKYSFYKKDISVGTLWFCN